MNIRRRLFISNLLMWLIPVTVSIAVYFGGLWAFAALAGLGGRERVIRPYMEAVREADGMLERWAARGAAIADMEREAAEFNERYAENGQAIMLYRDGEPVLSPPVTLDAEVAARVLGVSGDTALFGRVTARARSAGNYRAVFYEELRFAEMSPNYRSVMFNGTIASFVCAAVMVFVTNLYLTRFVFKRILRALGILTGGVRQIRDGNLGYRIEYPEDDEFAPVCGDFNQMAERLLWASEAKARDEQSRRELIAGISHDLRTPLTSIKAYVEGLAQGVAATPCARKRYIETLKNKAGDLEHIIEHLFLFSKLDTGEFPYRIERVDFRAVVSEIAGGVSAEYGERGLDIEQSAPGGPVYVNIDAARARYVLINIFENSLKYKEKERGRILLSVMRDGAEAVLTMTDDGPGVPGETLPKLFELFYRGDGSRSNPSRGSGLGLAIAAKMTKQFGGGITAENSVNGGLSIEIRLPAVL